MIYMHLRIFLFAIFPILCWSETVSVIVPCYYKHFCFLPELLYNLSLQTRLPDEVVISVSESDFIDTEQIKKIEQLHYPFEVHLLFHKEKLYAGENRNSACQSAVGDIFITQDADDLPHPQRIEILAEMFQRYDVYQILHTFVYPYYNNKSVGWNMLSLSDIPVYMMTSNFSENCWSLGQVTFGNMAIRREVFKKVKWSNQQVGEDEAFNRDVLQEFHKTLLIHADLLLYRQHFSSNEDLQKRNNLLTNYIWNDRKAP